MCKEVAKALNISDNRGMYVAPRGEHVVKSLTMGDNKKLKMTRGEEHVVVKFETEAFSPSRVERDYVRHSETIGDGALDLRCEVLEPDLKAVEQCIL